MTDAAPLAVDDVLAAYRARGYAGRIGLGARPVLLVIDLSTAFTVGTDGYPGGGFATVIAATRRLLDAARGRIPVIFTTIAYDAGMAEAGLWPRKVPWLTGLRRGEHAVDIDPALDRRADEPVLIKPFPSCFFATDLKARLDAQRADTLILAGCTTSCCVRATAVDAMQHGFRVAVPREAVGDFSAALHRAHLADIDARYGDVMATDEVLGYIAALDAGSGPHST
ncbi:MAG: isochorismatase family protein [Acetobacteraceae bacterium]